MEELKALDVTWSMGKTIEAIDAAITNPGDIAATLAIIDEKLVDVEEYFYRPLDSPEVYAKLKAAADSIGDSTRAANYQKNINLFHANELEFQGRLQNFFGNNTKALKAYEDALELVPDLELAVSGEKKAKNRVTKAQKEMGKWEAKVSEDPNDADSWTKLGVSQMDLDRESDAMDSFENALNIDPNHVDAMCRKGTALESKGNFEDAMPLFMKALEINPKSMIAKRGRNYAEGALDD